MVGCSAAVAAMSGARFSSLVFGAPGSNDDIMVVLFLRGGIDGLNIVMPTTHGDRGYYESARPTLQVPVTGPNRALPLGQGFGMHPSASPLHSLFQSGHLAIVRAAGIQTVASRSHFDAQEYWELGTPGDTTSNTGWLARHLSTATNLPPNIPMPSISVGGLLQSSLRGSLETININSVSDFNLQQGPWLWRSAHRQALRSLVDNGTSQIHVTCGQALDAVDVVELNTSGSYSPSNGANYPNNSYGNHLITIARMIKLGLGLRVATLDLGGWDTHNQQGDGAGGYFGGRLSDLAQGLNAFYTDLNGSGVNNYTSRLTVVVMSEFGRRLKQNNDAGTDHGYGSHMFVLGGRVNGGLYGTWPGLANGQLFDQADLAVTTDYRRVLSEILIRRFGNPNIGAIFPDYSSTYIQEGPLGIVQGTDIPVNQGPPLFGDGFESGNTGGWHFVTP